MPCARSSTQWRCAPAARLTTGHCRPLHGALSEFITAQLRQPEGAFGRFVIAGLLNRSNAELIDDTQEALRLHAEGDFLDVGFGGGRALALASRIVHRGNLYGVDVSADMVKRGARKFRRLIDAQRLQLMEADVVDLPLPDQSIDKICTTNTIYFWPDPARALVSLRRVMRPGAIVAIGFTGEIKMRSFDRISRQGFTSYSARAVCKLLDEAGFADVYVSPQQGRVSTGDYVARAHRPQ